jgi:hypothetical protein
MVRFLFYFGEIEFIFLFRKGERAQKDDHPYEKKEKSPVHFQFSLED